MTDCTICGQTGDGPVCPRCHGLSQSYRIQTAEPGYAVFHYPVSGEAPERFAARDLPHARQTIRAHMDAHRQNPSIEYVCTECGSPDLEVSAWVHVNTDTISASEGPLDTYYCPVCEEHFRGCEEKEYD